MKVDRNADCWENDYSRRGRVWGGAVHQLPSFRAGQRVLELGCGNGKTFSAVLEKKCEVVGIDFSSSAAILCRSLAPKTGQGQIALADVRHLPFADASFEVVIAFHVIGHLPAAGRVRCVDESARVLKAGGTLYFSGFSVGDFRAGTGRETEPGTFERKNGISTHYFTEEEVQSLFRSLQPRECVTRHWTMTVRGQPFPRAEIKAAFEKIS
jgi:ubiquinone/menaquinone biosynthesis C-methylase UbiE